MGCSSSKTQQAVLEPAVSGPKSESPEAPKIQEAVAVERAAHGQPETLFSQPLDIKAQEPMAKKAVAYESSSTCVKVHVVGARGLRKGDLFGKSEVFVEASIGGKPGSVARTEVAESHGDDAAAKTIRADFGVELEVKEYALGDAVMLLVKDKDRFKDDVLGRAVLSEEQLRSGFEGELALTDAGSEGQAFLRVSVEAQATAVDPTEEDPIEEIEEVLAMCGMGCL